MSYTGTKERSAYLYPRIDFIYVIVIIGQLFNKVNILINTNINIFLLLLSATKLSNIK